MDRAEATPQGMALTQPGAPHASGGVVRRSVAGLRARWRALARRERAAVLAATVVVGGAALWSGVVAPAWRAFTQAPAQLARLETELLRMRALAAEASLWRNPVELPEAQAREAAQAATARLGDAARLQWQGDRATLQVERVAPPSLWAWIAEVRSGARLHAEQVQLRRDGEALSGTVAVVRAHAP